MKSLKCCLTVPNSKQNVYGLPLDNRSTYSKSDWIIWTATMTDSQEDFEAFIDPLWKFYNETIDRVPMSDWFYTDKPEYCQFIARSVVGGYFIKMLPTGNLSKVNCN